MVMPQSFRDGPEPRAGVPEDDAAVPKGCAL